MKELMLLGSDEAHLELLARIAAKPLTGVQVSLIAPYPHHFCAGMLAGFVAGHRALEDCLVPLEPLLKKAGARWLGQRVAALQVEASAVRLDDGSTFGFSWLSIDTGPLQDRRQIEARLPGAREHGLFVYPLEAFAALWLRVTELGATRALRIAILGASTTSLELAMAIRQRLPGSSITLVAPGAALAADYPPADQAKVIKALKQRAITLLSDVAVGIQADQVLLGSGARLACDVPVIAFGAKAPAWLDGGGLTLEQNGSVAVDAWQRSISHPWVFAAAGVDTRSNNALARNLLAALTGSQTLQPTRSATTLKFLSFGDQRSLLRWGNWSAQGRSVAWLQDRLNQRCIQRYRKD